MGATREKGLRARRAAEIARNAPTPLLAADGSPESSMTFEEGQEVAWVIVAKRTDTAQKPITVGVSAVHRVFGGGKTYCGHAVPNEPQRFPPLKSLNACSTCERMWKRVQAREAAERQRAIG